MLITILFSTILLLMACSGDTEPSTNDDEIKENHSEDNVKKPNESTTQDNHSNETSSKENNVSSNSAEIENHNALSQYSVEEIEYARIWLQLGPNQELDELNVEYISKGTPLNPDDETSMDYLEDVIQLSGTRLVDGVITYSSNGNGTINVYHVPKRWDGLNPAGEDVYKKIIEDIDQESIDTGNDQKVEELIKILTINS